MKEKERRMSGIRNGLAAALTVALAVVSALGGTGLLAACSSGGCT